MTAPVPPSYAGKVVGGRYRVERLLGQGGMGSVWTGRHVSLDQLVAVKFIHPGLASSPDALRRFDNEAKAAARIKSRHAVAVYDHGVTEQGEPYIVMEYLEGESLEQAIGRRGRLPFDEVVNLVDQTVKALTAAHERGIVHRDLKPDNVFLSSDRDAGRFGYVIKVVDFGIAKLLSDEAAEGAAKTQAGMVLGTPHYMSPEALTASAPVGPASDIWSLGACAFAAAVGRVPFEGDAIGDVVLKVCAAPLPTPSKLVPELPRAFDAWFRKACARETGERFASAAEAGRALADLAGWNQREREHSAYELTQAPDLSLPDIDEPRTSRRGLVLGSVLSGASLMLAVLGYYVLQRTRAADAQAAAMAASASAIIEAENSRKLREAEAASWARREDAGLRGPDAGPPPAGSAARKKRRPR